MLIYVACWPLLPILACRLTPAIGAGSLPTLTRVVAMALGGGVSGPEACPV